MYECLPCQDGDDHHDCFGSTDRDGEDYECGLHPIIIVVIVLSCCLFCSCVGTLCMVIFIAGQRSQDTRHTAAGGILEGQQYAQQGRIVEMTQYGAPPPQHALRPVESTAVGEGRAAPKPAATGQQVQYA